MIPSPCESAPRRHTWIHRRAPNKQSAARHPCSWLREPASPEASGSLMAETDDPVQVCGRPAVRRGERSSCARRNSFLKSIAHRTGAQDFENCTRRQSAVNMQELAIRPNSAVRTGHSRAEIRWFGFRELSIYNCVLSSRQSREDDYVLQLLRKSDSG